MYLCLHESFWFFPDQIRHFLKTKICNAWNIFKKMWTYHLFKIKIAIFCFYKLQAVPEPKTGVFQSRNHPCRIIAFNSLFRQPDSPWCWRWMSRPRSVFFMVLSKVTFPQEGSQHQRLSKRQFCTRVAGRIKNAISRFRSCLGLVVLAQGYIIIMIIF